MDRSFAGGLVCHGDRGRFCGTDVRSRRRLWIEDGTGCVQMAVMQKQGGGELSVKSVMRGWTLDEGCRSVVCS
jgi:hypothetical protein